MRRHILPILAVLMLASPAAAAAPLEFVIFLSAQRLMILEGGQTTHEFDISSGKLGKWTPPGVYAPQSLSRHHKSSIYNNAPMPNSIFFNGNIALHGTYEENNLGLPVSNGCVRLALADSEIAFRLVLEYGKRNTQIRVVP